MAGIAAKSYSDALFSLGLEENKLDEYKQDILFIDETLKAYPDLMRVLTHPKIHKEEKKQTLETVFKDEIQHMVLNFSKLLIDKSRFQNFHDITKAFVKEYNRVNQIEVAYVKSAKELDETDLVRLQAMLEKKLQKKVELKVTQDPSLLAGIRIKINDTVLEYSAKNRIENLKRRAQNETVQES